MYLLYSCTSSVTDTRAIRLAFSNSIRLFLPTDASRRAKATLLNHIREVQMWLWSKRESPFTGRCAIIDLLIRGGYSNTVGFELTSHTT